MPLLALSHVTFRYAAETVLEDATVAVEPGRKIGVEFPRFGGHPGNSTGSGRGLVPYLCLKRTHMEWAPVGSRLDGVGLRWMQWGSAHTNYVNRIADGLGVDLEPEMKAQ